MWPLYEPKALKWPWKWKFCHLNGSVFCLNTRRFGIDEVCKIERIVCTVLKKVCLQLKSVFKADNCV